MESAYPREKTIFLPPAARPNEYNPPFQTRVSVRNPDFCVPINPVKEYNEESFTRDLPFDSLQMPIKYFFLFFTKHILHHIVLATNTYAAAKRAEAIEAGQNVTIRFWTDIDRDELVLWLGTLLYTSFIGIQSPSMCWAASTRVWQVADYMTEFRFKQILRYFHVALPIAPESAAAPNWYDKLEPIEKPIHGLFKRYIHPRTLIAIDEMMIKFTGRSKHTVKMSRKPIKEGYKILCSLY